MLAHALTDIGKVRDTNEDSFVCLPPLFVVADGMGGHVAGEIASRLAVETVAQHVAAHAGEANPQTLLSQAITQANLLICRMAQDKSEYAGMGTTVTAAYVGGSRLYWAHVGDSRLYLLRAGALRQLTADHSLVGELVKSGTITAEEALVHPHRNILTRAVGTGDAIRVDTGSLDLIPGDALLLCTDGLTNLVADSEIAALMGGGDVELVAVGLVDRANVAGGLDNITAIFVRPGVA